MTVLSIEFLLYSYKKLINLKLSKKTADIKVMSFAPFWEEFEIFIKVVAKRRHVAKENDGGNGGKSLKRPPGSNMVEIPAKGAMLGLLRALAEMRNTERNTKRNEERNTEQN